MFKYRLIGDVHGYFDRYEKAIANSPPSIQVGDMGVGFRRLDGLLEGEFYRNPPHSKMVEGNHRFIRGNHDNPAVCAKHSQWIADGTVEEDIMFVGGADSIDKQYRVKDYSWWEDEELSDAEFENIKKVYEYAKPRVMITHTAPTEATSTILQWVMGEMRYGEPTRSEDWFQRMLAIHRPELWVFGHWHHSFDKEVEGTRYVCLAELEYRDDLI
jgi:hypothetical protein